VLRERHLPPPLNRTGLGTVAGLEAITRADVVGHWRTWAKPQKAILAIAGAVDGDAVAKQLDGLLRGWTGSSAEVPMQRSATAGTYRHEQDESNQVHIYLAHDAPAERDADSALERVLSGVLSGGPSARLFTEVREKRALCYSVSAAYAADKSFGRMVAYVGTTPDKAQQSLDVLCEQLRLVTASGGGAMGITDDEVQRAVVGAKSSLVFSGESTSARAGALASDQHRLGRARSLQEIAASIDAVTLDALRAYVARRKPSMPTVVTLGPVGLVMPGW
jgi:predicted Zn-dependent peptidase